MSHDELVKLVLHLQAEAARVEQLEQTLNDLRRQVAESALNQEMAEENEANTFRRLSVECMEKGLPVELPQNRAGQGVDQAGSLNDVTIRREAAIANLASYSTSRDGSSASAGFNSAIKVMHNSLQQDMLAKQSSAKKEVPTMSSFKQDGLASAGPAAQKPQFGAFKDLAKPPIVSAPLAPVLVKPVITMPVGKDEESDGVEVVI